MVKVVVEQLRLGESVVVSHVAAPPRSRRAKRKAARKAAKLEQRRVTAQAKREASRRYARAMKKAAEKEEMQATRARCMPVEEGAVARSRRPEVAGRSEGDLEGPA